MMKKNNIYVPFKYEAELSGYAEVAGRFVATVVKADALTLT